MITFFIIFSEILQENKTDNVPYNYNLLVLLGLKHDSCFKIYKNRVKAQFFCAEGISGEQALEGRDRCNVSD